MGPLIIADFVVGGIFLAVALLHLIIFFRRWDRKADLLFALVAVFAAGSVLAEPWMYQAQNLAVFMPAFKVQITFQGLLWISLIWFIVLYTKTTWRWLAIVVTGAYGLAVAVNILSPGGVLYAEVSDLQSIMLPWGERVSYAIGTVNPWRHLADGAWVLLLVLAMQSCAHLYRDGARRQSLTLGISLLLFIGFGYLHDILLDFGLVRPPAWLNFTFLGLVLVMSISLAGEVVQASVLNQEVVAQQRRWQSLLDNVQFLVSGLDRQGRINYVNPYFTEILGTTEAEVLGKPFTDFIPERHHRHMMELFVAALDGAIDPQIESTLLARDGAERQVLWSNVLQRDEDNAVTAVLSIGDDVTDLRQAEHKLRGERERMSVILAALNTGLTLLSRDLTVVWANEKTRSMYPWDDPVGKKCFAFAENRDTPCDDCGAIQAFADGKVHETVRQNSLDNRWYHIVSLPIQNEKRDVVNVLESVTDITERKHLEESRDQALQELEMLKNRLEEENIYLREEILIEHGFTEIVGESNALRYILSKVQQVAATDATVLIQGETGVGKELIARAIHQASNRAEKPFIRVNCAALPPSLVESELFGHEPGAFTGATKLRKGRFELADGGTLFLDEVSELPLETQAKLLRVIQEGEFERVGSSVTRTVNVRFIASSNHNLTEEVANGRFRPDLYYRLNVYPLTVPPLRERKEDIPLLVQHFVPQIAAQLGKPIDQVPPLVMEQLTAYDWPGNVRELRNILEQAVILSPKTVLQLPPTFRAVPEKAPMEPAEDWQTMEEMERQYILKVLDKTNGQIEGQGGAAEILRLKASTLRSRLKKLGIRRP
jgi:PAS domain S-box-containing protein